MSYTIEKSYGGGCVLKHVLRVNTIKNHD